MKRIATTLAALAVMSVGVTACGTDSDHHADAEAAKDKAAAQTQQETEEPEPVDDTELFLTVVRDQYPLLNTVDDPTLIALPLAACRALDAGVPIEELLLTATTTSDLDPEMVGYVIGAGIQTYCPEHVSELTGAGEVA